MKKRLLGIWLFILAVAVPRAVADEGMWLLPLIEKLNLQQMQKKGLKLSAEQLYSTDQLALKDAIVIFGGGCTGEVISPEGLVLTNHHCGYGAIQQHSSPEHDYLRNGFWAMNRAEEIPTPGLAVTFIREIRDVTDEVTAKVKESMTPEQRTKQIRKVADKLAKKNSDAKAFRSAQVVPMFGGNRYFLFVAERFTDVRMVGAPPSSIGKFGGDTDNWMWPRHTGDFALFRIYASPDNKAAAYSENNVPYRAPKHLEISMKGYREGDFAMIMGFPGSTNRYMTTYELDQLTEQDNPVRIFVRGERQQLMWADMMADPKVRIQYATKYAGSSNYWKNSIGMNKALAERNVRAQKAAEEAAFTAWVDASPERRAKYAQALPMIEEAVARRRKAAGVRQYMSETLSRSVESFVLGNSVYTILENEKKDAKAVTKLRKAGEDFFKNYNPPTDRKITPRMLEIFADNVSAEEQPAFFAGVRSDIPRYAALLADHSLMTDSNRYYAALENFNRSAWKADPAVIAAASITEKNKELTDNALKEAGEKFALGHRLWIAGLMEMQPERPFYPDANFTIRLTYGQVLPYWQSDAVLYEYYTTLDGVIAKFDPGNPDFTPTPYLKELYDTKDYGPYEVHGTVPVNMLTTNDITGGNSGSGVMDGNGRLIGLAFDGNWEAMSGDITFAPDVQRTISVDIRYVLFIIDKFAGAGHLLEEMTIVR